MKTLSVSDIITRLREAHQKSGLSVQEISAWIGIDRSTVHTWLNGTTLPFTWRAQYLTERLMGLERALRADELPVPGRLRLSGRRIYLNELAQRYDASSVS